MTLPRVVYWHNMPSPYMVERFNALSRRGNLEFEAWFNERRESDRSWDVSEADWEFPARYIPLRLFGGRRLRLPVPEMRSTRPDMLVSLHASLSYALGSMVARAQGARTAFRVLPTFDAWVRRAAWKELSKHFLFRSVDGVKVPGRDGARMAQQYGVPYSRVCAVTQSIDARHYRRALEVSDAWRSKRRAELGLRGCVFLYVGRLWSGKGLDYLFEAYRSLLRQCPNTSLLLVGDGVDENQYRTLARDLPGVSFAGFVQTTNLPEYYALADVFVFPTLGDPHGLVVEEAMAAGLPVICTEAAGDIRHRLPEGEAGYVIPPMDATCLADRMLLLARDGKLRKGLASKALQLVADQSHERWAVDFEAFIERILSLPPRRSPQAIAAATAGRLVLGAAGSSDPPSPLVSYGRGEMA